MTRAPCRANRSAIISGRSVGAPTPAAAPGQDTMRDRPFSRSIAGITSTRGGRRWTPAAERRASRRRVWQQPFVAQQAAMERDGQAAVVEQGVVEPSKREPIAEPTLLVAAELE